AWGYVPNVRWQFQPTLLHRLILGLPFGRCTAGTLDCTIKETRPEVCRIKANKMERTLETLQFSLAVRACSRSLNEPLFQTNQSSVHLSSATFKTASSSRQTYSTLVMSG